MAFPAAQAATAAAKHAASSAMMKTFRIYRWSPDAAAAVAGGGAMTAAAAASAASSTAAAGAGIMTAAEPPPRAAKPRMDHFTIDISKCGPMVLDALAKIKSEQDPSLTYRRSCREGICGSCSMNINGVNTLACLTPVGGGEGEVTSIMPLPHMFVIKDLVVDLTHQYQQYKSIEPWLKTSSTPSDGKEHRQSIEERQMLDGRYECILCFCCTASCPSWWWSSEKFLGPAALINMSRWVFDSRDEFTNERLSSIGSDKMFRCHTIMNCAKTCPKHLNLGKSIAQMRRALLASNFTSRPDLLLAVNPTNLGALD